MSAKQIAKIAKDLSLARAEIDRLEKELAGLKGASKAAPAKKKAPVKPKAPAKKAPAKKPAAAKKSAPAKPAQKGGKKMVGDFDDKAYLQVVLASAKKSAIWSAIVAELNAKGYTTKQGNTIAANNFTRDLSRRLQSSNAEVKKLTEQIFACFKK